MCGIAGILSTNDDAAPVARMVAAMRHRGPDADGVAGLAAGARRVWLGSARLAILDRSPAGRMPMVDAASGNRIVYNGEVYNFKELRRHLEREGETFSSDTDTEAVLKAYRRWGHDLPARLRGMFALAIWDQARQELFLARDRLGEKPLYYRAGPDGEFLFASEVRALLASGRVERRLDPAALEVYLANGFLVTPQTLVEGVRSMPPGSWMRVSREGRVIGAQRYWTPRRTAAAELNGDGPLRLEQELDAAVAMRLASDVPMGVFLSGGADSSILVGLAASRATRLRTFSVTFDEPYYDESPYSAWVAQRFATDHTEVRLRREEFARWLPDAVAAMDQPSFDGINTYYVSRAAKASGLTVALSGLGADELFGGYPHFRSVPWVRRSAGLISRVPAGWKRGLAEAAGCRGFRVAAPWKLAEAMDLNSGESPKASPLAAYQAAQMLFPCWTRRALAAGGQAGGAGFGLPEEFTGWLYSEILAAGPGEDLSLTSLRLFLGERCLRDTDAASMASSIEVRTAFTDHRFLELALAVPAARRCAGAPHKPYLRRIFQKLLGADFPWRRKQGFVLPLRDWLGSGPAAGMIREELHNRDAVRGAGLDPGAVAAVLAGYEQSPRRVPWSRVWALFMLVQWCRRHGVYRS